MLVKRMKGLQMLGIAVIALLAWPSLAGAQSFPRLKPLPPHKDATAVAAVAATSTPSSSWQLLTNQPPVLNYVECGPGNPPIAHRWYCHAGR